MRRICLILLAVALAAPGLAAADRALSDRAAADGSLSISGASGTLWVSGSGVFYGHFDQGQLLVLSYKPDDGVSVPAVSSPKGKYKGGAGVYTGNDVRFLFASGKYTIELIATDVNLSAVGKGSVVATSAPSADPSVPSGSFTVNGGKPQGLSRGSTTATFGGSSNPQPPATASSATTTNNGNGNSGKGG